MAAVSHKSGLGGKNGFNDPFPVGMSVLAIDNNEDDLGILELMLWKCQYQVAAESRADVALRMLWENRIRYDLVITEVKMAGIDGLELLKVVGGEMGIPVIMLSDCSDTALVTEAISHGACDYLLKPVRIQELKNMWQHVLRRKEFEPPRKRKSEEDNKGAEKKCRVVWSMEMHYEFSRIINQLGIDEAEPLKIMELMNAQGITPEVTEEEVAPRLKSYRDRLEEGRYDNTLLAMHEKTIRMNGGIQPNTHMNGGIQPSVCASNSYSIDFGDTASSKTR